MNDFPGYLIQIVILVQIMFGRSRLVGLVCSVGGTVFAEAFFEGSACLPYVLGITFPPD